MTDSDSTIPFGCCHCGCGGKTTIPIYNNTFHGRVKGRPLKFITGHNGKIDVRVRFWSYVDRKGDDDCWLWTGCLHDGYGWIGRGGRHSMVLAHRLSWELHYGPIPTDDSSHGVCVLHQCDVRGCVNPKHLTIDSQAQNVREAFDRGLMPVGEKHYLAKLTDAAVKAMRIAHFRDSVSCKELAVRYGVNIVTAHNAVSRKTWKHIP